MATFGWPSASEPVCVGSAILLTDKWPDASARAAQHSGWEPQPGLRNTQAEVFFAVRGATLLPDLLPNYAIQAITDRDDEMFLRHFIPINQALLVLASSEAFALVASRSCTGLGVRNASLRRARRPLRRRT